MLISILDKVAKTCPEEYNPSSVIEAVNALQPLGKEKALELFDTYLKNRDKGSPAYGLFWVLRVLFEVPTEVGFPPVRIGRPSIPPPSDPEQIPTFPILTIRDFPFLVISGYDLGGLPEQVETHAAYFRTQGTIREQSLKPPVSPDGIEEEFLKRWNAAYGDAYATEALKTIKTQMAKLGG